MKNLKLISTILLTLVLVVTISTSVFAATTEDDNFWTDANSTTENSTFNDISSNSTVDNSLYGNSVSNSTYNSTYNGTYNSITTSNSISNSSTNENSSYTFNNTTTSNSSRNSTTTNSTSLASTGIGNFNGILTLIIVISLIVAIYSAKKFNDYKNM